MLVYQRVPCAGINIHDTLTMIGYQVTIIPSFSCFLPPELLLFQQPPSPTPEVPRYYAGEDEPGRGLGLPWHRATRLGRQRAGPARLQGRPVGAW